MSLMRFVSWNVNGFRAVSKKSDWEWFSRTQADVVGLQETKASPEQIPAEQREPEGWHAWWSASTVKKGYSGVAVFSRRQPLNVEYELPDTDYHGEGRVLHLEFPELHYFNIYFPNGGEEVSKGVFRRVPYKMGFFNAFLEYAEELRQDKPIVVCGDFNISHREIDLARPRENVLNTGFLYRVAAGLLFRIVRASEQHPRCVDRKRCLWFRPLSRGAGAGAVGVRHAGVFARLVRESREKMRAVTTEYSGIKKAPMISGRNMGRITGFEPATPWATTRCSAN